MQLTDIVIKKIITHVLKSEDYRLEVVNLINAKFLDFTIEFFKKVAEAKLNSEEITIDWYKQKFVSNATNKEVMAINAGLNMKTIKNMYGSVAKKVVIEASNKHFETLYNTIQELAQNEKDFNLMLTLKFNNVSIDLNLSESLIVINTLAVKRAALRGGLWSSVGKRAEKFLMLTLCKLYKVKDKYYDAKNFVKDKTLDVDREVDFYFVNKDKEYKCEVKLMGAGNPESADAIIARESALFVADTLSQQNKNQCDQKDINWVACHDPQGYKRITLALDKFEIPYKDYNGDLDKDLPKILDELL